MDDIKSRLPENRPRELIDDEMTPEERLQRLVLASLQDDDETPVRVSAAATSAMGGTRRRWWPGVGLFASVVIVALGAGGALLLVAGRHNVVDETRPGRTAAKEPTEPAPASAPASQPPASQPPVSQSPASQSQPADRPSQPLQIAIDADTNNPQPDTAPANHIIPWSAPLRNPHSLGPVAPTATRQDADSPLTATAQPSPETQPVPAITAENDPDLPVPPVPPVPPKPADTMRPESAKLPATQRDPRGATHVGADHVSETDKPVVWIYYPFGAAAAVENARTLATQVSTDATSVDFMVQAEVPRIAVIRISEDKNRALAQAMCKTLANFGYRWRFENVSNSVSAPHNMIEVWLPTKPDGRPSSP